MLDNGHVRWKIQWQKVTVRVRLSVQGQNVKNPIVKNNNNAHFCHYF